MKITELGMWMRSRVLPPTLTTLARILDGSLQLTDFFDIVRTFTPDEADHVLTRRTVPEMMEAWLPIFEQHHFPLNADAILDSEELEGITYSIPIVLYGLSEEEFHYAATDYRIAMRLGLVTFQDPFGDWEDDTRGARLALFESILSWEKWSARDRKRVETALKRIPAAGYEPWWIRRQLDGTEFAPLIDDMRWWWGNTGSFFADATYETHDSHIDWSAENVAELTEQWQQFTELNDRTNQFHEWLEAAPANRFCQMIEILGDQPPRVGVAREILYREAFDDDYFAQNIRIRIAA